jgi:hypothetical protein
LVFSYVKANEKGLLSEQSAITNQRSAKPSVAAADRADFFAECRLLTAHGVKQTLTASE